MNGKNITLTFRKILAWQSFFKKYWDNERLDRPGPRVTRFMNSIGFNNFFLFNYMIKIDTRKIKH